MKFINPLSETYADMSILLVLEIYLSQLSLSVFIVSVVSGEYRFNHSSDNRPQNTANDIV